MASGALQSPARSCRTSRMDGYHGVSRRAWSQRQSGAMSSIIQQGRPSVPARWPIGLSSLTTISNSSSIAAAASSANGSPEIGVMPGTGSRKV